MNADRSRQVTLVTRLRPGFASLACACRAALVLILLHLVWHPTPTRACSCSDIAPTAYVSPGSGQIAPLNTEIRVHWHGSNVDTSTVSVAPLPLGTHPPVAVTRRSRSVGEWHRMALTPRAALAPETRYAVLGARAPDQAPEILGEVTTGTRVDVQTPSWAGVARARYVRRIVTSCDSGAPYVEVELRGAAPIDDDPELDTNLRFGVWIAEGAFDPRTIPVAYASLEKRSNRLAIGAQSMCGGTVFSLPAQPSLALWIAPLDLAGHVGTPARIEVDLRGPPITDEPAAAGS